MNLLLDLEVENESELVKKYLPSLSSKENVYVFLNALRDSYDSCRLGAYSLLYRLRDAQGYVPGIRNNECTNLAKKGLQEVSN